MFKKTVVYLQVITATWHRKRQYGEEIVLMAAAPPQCQCAAEALSPFIISAVSQVNGSGHQRCQILGPKHMHNLAQGEH